MTEPASQQTDQHRAMRSGLTGPVLWSGIAWLAVATAGLVPTAVLLVREITAMVAFIVGLALVGLPLYTVFQLWYTRTVEAAVRSAVSSFGLAALVLAMWTAGRSFDWTVAAIAAALVIPGGLSLFAARQVHIENRARRAARGDPGDAGESISPAELVVIVLILVGALVGALVVLEPTFSTPIAP